MFIHPRRAHSTGPMQAGLQNHVLDLKVACTTWGDDGQELQARGHPCDRRLPAAVPCSWCCRPCGLAAHASNLCRLAPVCTHQAAKEVCPVPRAPLARRRAAAAAHRRQAGLIVLRLQVRQIQQLVQRLPQAILGAHRLSEKQVMNGGRPSEGKGADLRCELFLQDPRRML